MSTVDLDKHLNKRLQQQRSTSFGYFTKKTQTSSQQLLAQLDSIVDPNVYERAKRDFLTSNTIGKLEDSPVAL